MLRTSPGAAVFQAAAIVGALTLLVKVVAALKEIVIAYRVGLDPALDAFLIAYLFPSFLLNVISGSLTVAFVPVYTRVLGQSGQHAASHLVWMLTLRLASALLVLVLLLTPALLWLLPYYARGFDADTLTLARKMTALLMPLLVLSGVTSFWAGALNAQHRFALAAIAPIVTPAAVMLALALLWETLGIYCIVVGSLIGAVVELFLIGRRMPSAFAGSAVVSAHDRSQIGQLWTQFWPVVASNVLIGGTLVIDQTMAASLGQGSVAALTYGAKVTVVRVSVGSMALATALLPHFSRLVYEENVDAIRGLIRQYSVLVLLVTGLITFLIVATSDQIVRLLYVRGAFSPDDAIVVSRVQWMYALQIPFFTWSMIAVRLISALRKNYLLTFGAFTSLLLDVVLNLWLSRHLGIAGIALATSVVYFLACIFLWWGALREFKLFSSGVQLHRVAVDLQGK